MKHRSSIIVPRQLAGDFDEFEDPKQDVNRIDEWLTDEQTIPIEILQDRAEIKVQNPHLAPLSFCFKT